MKNLKRILSALFCVLLVLTVLHVFASASGTPWDGKTIDVSWYSKNKIEFHISTLEQLMGLPLS